MKEFDINAFIKRYVMVGIPMVYVVGFLVHSSYLAGIGTFEFELIKARYIFVGGMFLLTYFVAFVFVGKAVDDFDELRPIKYISHVYFNCLGLIGFLFYVVNGVSERSDAPIEVVSFSSILLLFFTIYSFGHYKNIHGEKGQRIFEIVIMVLLPPSLAFSIYFAFVDELFRDVAFLVSLVAISHVSFLAGRVDREIKEEDGALYHIDPFYGKLTFLAVAVFVLGLYLSVYINGIYSKIPIALGGGKSQSAILYMTDNELLEVEVLQEGSGWILYFEKNTGALEKMKIDSVKRIAYCGILNCDKSKISAGKL